MDRFGAGRPVHLAGAFPSLYLGVERVPPKSTRLPKFIQTCLVGESPDALHRL